MCGWKICTKYYIKRPENINLLEAFIVLLLPSKLQDRLPCKCSLAEASSLRLQILLLIILFTVSKTVWCMSLLAMQDKMSSGLNLKTTEALMVSDNLGSDV